jgi:hypothetical protein
VPNNAALIAIVTCLAPGLSDGTLAADTRPNAPATAPAPPVAPALASAVVPLLEDDAQTLLPLLTNPTGDPGEGHVEQSVVFSGTSAVKIIPMQRFSPGIPGWGYRITEKPGPGEYRYVRFTWRAEQGAAGIMIQFHDDKDWNVRYTAGADQYNWGTKFVADRPPTDWVVVTRDLYADFGAPRTIRGMALTVFGKPGYFDHVYLGRTIEDLDRVDATGLRNGPPVRLAPADLERLWGELSGDDAAKAYLAFWTLAADPQRAVPFLRGTLRAFAAESDPQRIRRWIAELDADEFLKREEASRRLAEHLDAAAGLLRQALRQNLPEEARIRITRLLAMGQPAAAAGVNGQKPEALAEAVRILEYEGGREATECLEELSRGAEGSRLTLAAKAALLRCRERAKRTPASP